MAARDEAPMPSIIASADEYDDDLFGYVGFRRGFDKRQRARLFSPFFRSAVRRLSTCLA